MLADVRRGFVSAEQARGVYGVVITMTPPAGLTVDEAATATLRQTMTGEPPRDTSALIREEPAVSSPHRFLASSLDRSRPGSWRAVSSSYLDNTMAHCDFCGKWLPRQAWVDEVHGPAKQFCHATCAALYEAYWLPRYGPPGDSVWP